MDLDYGVCSEAAKPATCHLVRGPLCILWIGTGDNQPSLWLLSVLPEINMEPEICKPSGCSYGGPSTCLVLVASSLSLLPTLDPDPSTRSFYLPRAHASPCFHPFLLP